LRVGRSGREEHFSFSGLVSSRLAQPPLRIMGSRFSIEGTRGVRVRGQGPA
jgi:hypothetical protein